MSFANLANVVIKNMLGDFIEDLDPAALDVSLLSGEAKLKGLKLKQSVLNTLNLPIELKQGYLGEIFMKLPWAHLKEERAVVKIRDLYLLTGPKVIKKLSRAESEAVNLHTKQSKLRVAEIAGMDDPTGEQDQTQQTQDKGILEELALKVLDNMQIFVENVHFRYEDAAAMTTKPFSFGFCIDHIHMQSTDANWTPIFLHNSEQIIRKLLKLDSLAVYFCDEPKFLKFTTVDEMVTRMRELIRVDERGEKPRKPGIRGHVKAEFNSKKGDLSRPRMKLEIELDNLVAQVNPEQYMLIGAWTKYIHDYTLRSNHLEFVRPVASVQQDPKAWWEFCIACKRVDANRQANQWRWQYVKERWAKRDRYVRLFRRRLEQGLEKLEPNELKELNEIEAAYEFEDLFSWRKLAHSAIRLDQQQRKELEKKKEEKKESMGFFKALFATEKELTESFKETALKDLYTAIGFDEESARASAVYPKDFVHTVITFNVKQTSFALGDEKKDPIVCCRMDLLTVQVRVKERSFNIFSCIDGLTVDDRYTLTGQSLEMITTDKLKLRSDSSGHKTQSMVEFEIDIADALQKEELSSIRLASQPLIFTFSRPVIQRCIQFFDSGNAAFVELAQLGSSGLDSLQVELSEKLASTIQNRQQFRIDIKVASIVLLVPVDPLKPKKSALLFELGDLVILSENITEQAIAELDQAHKEAEGALKLTDGSTEQVEGEKKALVSKNPYLKYLRFYDSYTLELRNINCRIAKSFGNWRELSAEKEAIDYLFPEFGIKLTFRRRLAPFTTIPMFLFEAKMDSFQLFFAQSYIKDLFAVVKSVMKRSKSGSKKKKSRDRTRTGKRSSKKVEAEPTTVASSTVAPVPLLGHAGSGTSLPSASQGSQSSGSSIWDSFDKSLETIKKMNQTSQESKIIFCAFEIGELRMTLRHQQQQASEGEPPKKEEKKSSRDTTPIRPLVVAGLNEIMVNIHINERDASVNGVLRGLFIQNFINQDDSREPCYIVNAIHTLSDTDALLTVDYNWASKDAASYRRIENLMSVKLNRVHVIVDRPVIARLMCVMIEIGHAIAPTLTKAKKLYDDAMPAVTPSPTSGETSPTSPTNPAFPTIVPILATASSSAQNSPQSKPDALTPNNSAKAKMLRSSSSGGLSAMIIKSSNRLSDQRRTSTSPTESPTSSAALEELEETKQILEKATNKIDDSCITLFRLNVKVNEEIRVTLRIANKPFVDAYIDGGSFRFSLYKGTGLMVAGGEIGGFTFCDVEQTRWSNIFKVERGKEMASFTYRSYSRFLPAFPGYDDKFDVRVNKMKLVLRAKVLFELANYFSAFDVLKNKLLQLKNEHFKEALRLDQLPDLLADSVEEPQAAVEDDLIAKTKFKIDIATPTVIIPRSSNSHSVLQCNLGHIKIESSFGHIEQPSEDVVGEDGVVKKVKKTIVLKKKHFTVDDLGIQITEDQRTSSLLVPCNVLASLTTAVNNPHFVVPHHQLEIEGGKIMIKLSGDQIAFLMNIVTDNLLECPAPINEDELRKIVNHDVLTKLSGKAERERMKASATAAGEAKAATTGAIALTTKTISQKSTAKPKEDSTKAGVLKTNSSTLAKKRKSETPSATVPSANSVQPSTATTTSPTTTTPMPTTTPFQPTSSTSTGRLSTSSLKLKNSSGCESGSERASGSRILLHTVSRLLEIPIAANEADQEAINKQILFAVRMRLQEFSFLFLVSPSANKERAQSASSRAASGASTPISSALHSPQASPLASPLTQSSSVSALQSKRKEPRKDADNLHMIVLDGSKKKANRRRSLSGVETPNNSPDKQVLERKGTIDGTTRDLYKSDSQSLKENPRSLIQSTGLPLAPLATEEDKKNVITSLNVLGFSFSYDKSRGSTEEMNLNIADIIVRYPESQPCRQYLSDFFSFNVTDPNLAAIRIAYRSNKKQGKTVSIVLDRPYITPNAAATVHLYRCLIPEIKRVLDLRSGQEIVQKKREQYNKDMKQAKTRALANVLVELQGCDETPSSDSVSGSMNRRKSRSFLGASSSSQAICDQKKLVATVEILSPQIIVFQNAENIITKSFIWDLGDIVMRYCNKPEKDEKEKKPEAPLTASTANTSSTFVPRLNLSREKDVDPDAFDALRTVTITVTDTCLYHSQFDCAAMKPISALTRLLAPTTIKVNIGIDVLNRMKTDVALHTISMSASYNDVSEICHMYVKWIPLFKELEKAPQQFGSQLDKIRGSIAEAMTERSTKVNFNTSLKSEDKEVMGSLKVDTITLSLLDDVTYKNNWSIPIVQLLTKEIKLSLTALNNGTVTTLLQFPTLYLNSYNHHAGDWEPLIERWALNVSLSRVFQEATKRNIFELVVSSKVPLLVNLTGGFIRTWGHLAHCVKEDFELLKEHVKRRKAEALQGIYKVINHASSPDAERPKTIHKRQTEPKFAQTDPVSHKARLVQSTEGLNARNSNLADSDSKVAGDMSPGRGLNSSNAALLNTASSLSSLSSESNRTSLDLNAQAQACYEQMQTINTEKRSHDLLRLKNHSGVGPIRYWWSQDDSATREYFCLMDAKDVLCQVRNESRTQDVSSDFSFQFLALGDLIIDSIFWNKNKVFSQRIQIPPEMNRVMVHKKESANLIIEVEEVECTKLITFRSTSKIFNSSHIPFEIELATDVRINLDSGASCGVAIVHPYPSNIIARITPNSLEYGWENFNIEEGVLKFQHLTDPTKQLHYKIQRTTKRLFGDIKDKIYSIRAPLVIQNTFLHTLSYRLYTDKKLIHSGAIPHDAIQDISISPVLNTLAISLHLPGLEWSEPVEIAQMKAFTNFKLLDKEGRRLKISLAQEIGVNDESPSMHLVAYVPYFLVNHTGLNVYYYNFSKLKATQCPGQTLSIPVSWESDPVTWYTRDNPDRQFNVHYYHNDDLSIAVENSTNCKEFNIRSHEGIITLDGKNNTGKYYVVLNVRDAPFQYWRSKLVFLSPAFYLVNNTSITINYRYKPQALTSSAKEYFLLKPDSQIPYHLNNVSFQICHDQSGEWSNDLVFAQSGYFQLVFTLRDGTKAQINVEIREVENVIYAIFRNSNGNTLYTFKNDTHHTAFVKEDASEKFVEVAPHSTIDWYWLKPQSIGKLRIKFAMDNAGSTTNSVNPNDSPIPSERHLHPRAVNSSVGQTSSNSSLSATGPATYSEIATLNFQKLTRIPTIQTKEGWITVLLVAEGISKCVLCSYSKTSPKDESDDTANFTITCRLESVGVSVIDHRPRELLYLYLRDITMVNIQKSTTDEILLTIAECQWDNQLHPTAYPILMSVASQPGGGATSSSSTNVTPSPSKSALNALSGSDGQSNTNVSGTGTNVSREIMKEKDKQPFLMARVVKDPRFLNLDVYQEFKIQVQEVDLKVDQVFLLYLCEYFIWLSNNVFQQYSLTLLTKLREGYVFDPFRIKAKIIKSSAFLFFETFSITSTKLNLSYLPVVTIPKDNHISASSVAMALFLARKLPVEVNNTPLVLNRLDLPSPFTTKEQLMLRVQNHYLNEVSRQAHKIVMGFVKLKTIGAAKNAGAGMAKLSTGLTKLHSKKITSSDVKKSKEINPDLQSSAIDAPSGNTTPHGPHSKDDLVGTSGKDTAKLGVTGERHVHMSSETIALNEKAQAGGSTHSTSTTSKEAKDAGPSPRGYTSSSSAFAKARKFTSNAAFGALVSKSQVQSEGLAFSIHHFDKRKRLPRFFPENGILLPFHEEFAFAQMMYCEILQALGLPYEPIWGVQYYKDLQKFIVLFSKHTFFVITRRQGPNEYTLVHGIPLTHATVKKAEGAPNVTITYMDNNQQERSQDIAFPSQSDMEETLEVFCQLQRIDDVKEEDFLFKRHCPELARNKSLRVKERHASFKRESKKFNDREELKSVVQEASPRDHNLDRTHAVGKKEKKQSGQDLIHIFKGSTKVTSAESIHKKDKQDKDTHKDDDEKEGKPEKEGKDKEHKEKRHHNIFKPFGK